VRAVGVGRVLLVLLAWGCAEAPPPGEDLSEEWPPARWERPLTSRDLPADLGGALEVFTVADRRVREAGDLDRLVEATGTEDPGVRRAAVRALGRLERSDLAGAIALLLEDPNASVRMEAANALAQAVRDGSPTRAGEGRDLLLDLMETEEDPEVLGALARAAGRIPGESQRDLRRVEAALTELANGRGLEEAEISALRLGIARGGFFLYRWAGSAGLPPAPQLLDVLEELAVEFRAGGGEGEAERYVRRAAAQALLAAGGPSLEVVEQFLADPEPEVRRLGALALQTQAPEGPAAEMASRAMEDGEFRVRIEGVRARVRLVREGVDEEAGCRAIVAATEDPWDHVALVALDGLADTCPGGEVDDALERLAEHLPDGAAGGWHRPVRAFSALSQRAPSRARGHVERFTGHGSPFVRAHAARAAVHLADAQGLRALAGDPDVNVREAAVTGLVTLAGLGHWGLPVDSVLVAQFEMDDPQLLRTTTFLMEGLQDEGEAVEALFGALERLTAQEAPTTRDARLPLLRRIGELADSVAVRRVSGWMNDPDTLIALEARRILVTREAAEPDSPVETGVEAEGPTSAPLRDEEPPAWGFPDLPLPTMEELRAMEEARVVVELDHGGRFVLRLLPWEAPTNAARFWRMAQEGTFEGLTLHRVVPNFVVQGGSPGANEYAGHGAYTRDERGMVGHWRGTLGISTRGRDTGDGQIFVNLVDNLRLDHDYTVFGVVVEGMEEADRIQEGTRILSVGVEEERD
jgi:cyclophilin family peptidyl-prolyl cis-trans isomerase/HEAT repeat protein